MSVYFDAITERRFYPRIAPTRPLYVPFGGKNLAMLLNLSENGLLVSTPAGLDPNSVFRISLRLNGIPKPIEVHVRTIWTSESKERAGIQLLDLSDHDREQIRKWGASELANSQTDDAAPDPELLRPLGELGELPASPNRPIQPSQLGAIVDSVVAETLPDAREMPVNSAPRPAATNVPPLPDFPATRVVIRSRRRSSAAAMVAWGAVGAIVCLAAALFLDRGLAEQLLGSATAHSLQVAVTPASPDRSPVNRVENSAPKEVSQPAEKSQLRRTSARSQDEEEFSAGGSQAVKTQSASESLNGVEASTSPKRDLSTVSFSPPTTAPTKPTPTPAETSPISTPSSVETAAPPLTVPSNAPAIGEGNSSNSGSFAAAIPRSSAIVGSISNSTTPAASASSPSTTLAHSNSSPSPTSTNPGWGSGAPAPAGKSRNSLLNGNSSNSPVIQMDVNPGPAIAITAPRGIGSSYITVPGERVIETQAMTMHIRRAVRVPAEHWIWRSRKPVTMGELASRVDPQTQQRSAAGSITVRATVDKDGRVSDLKPLNGSFALLPAVTRAVREWRYEPTYFDGKPVETRAEIEINFHMTSGGNHP